MPKFAVALVLGAATLAAQTATTGPYGMQFVQIPSGEFSMGCSPGDAECAASESPAHRVRITKTFQIGRHEVTQEQWEAVMGSNPSYSKGAARPVEPVSWDEIQEFLRRLNGRGDGFRYRLPTEAEWEYTARAGAGDRYAGAAALPDVAWDYTNSGGETQPVGQKQPNAWGLYDTLGNVYEWCQDWFEEAYYAASPQDDPAGPASGTYRVIRGGSWVLNSWFVRVSSRLRFPPADGYAGIGFRCVREVAPASTCALACLASGPSSGTTGAAVSFTASATLAGCSGTPAFSWVFGDGGSSAQQNPSYAYQKSGSYTWTMTVSAAGATACARSGSIQISTGCASPSITAQPAGQSIAAGSTAALTVTASGSAPLSYQWYEGASGDTAKPVGTNSPTFRASAPAAATSYWVRVTNACGQVDSAAATVSAAPFTGPNGIQFMQIQPGEFTMGCSPGDAACYGDESPAHRVRITRSFQIGKYEVTQDQWQAVMGTSPSWFQGATLPVEMVSWDDVQGFLGRLNARNDGFRYRLPTEAEWEYAARAGTTDRYAGAGALGDAAWYSGNSTRPVGQKRPNAWGLHDMLGNVYEWCQDWYGSYSSGAADNPTGPASGQYRVLRGGSWIYIAGLTRVSYRDRSVPGERQGSIGFRCVREAVSSSCAGPAITTQPAGQTIPAGSTADLTVTASGSAPLSYQWYEGARGTTTKPVGTNSAAFRTPALTATATYWVRVTNACGQADSAAAVVSVTAPSLRNGFGIEFVQIQPGEFIMGCSGDDGECYNDESPAHRVRITKSFQIGKYEVTQEQWQAAMGPNPSRFQDPSRPVEMVSWEDAQEFLRRMNSSGDGYLYRLPTEAEWEYAARAGTTGRYAGASALDAVAWYSGSSTQPVGQKQPNAWGVYDMLGNVWEWCQDWYDAASYYPSSQQVDPTGPASGTYRILRGGSWIYAVGAVRVSYRNRDLPGYRSNSVGFRCVREAIP